jgi:hypothetical protein
MTIGKKKIDNVLLLQNQPLQLLKQLEKYESNCVYCRCTIILVFQKEEVDEELARKLENGVSLNEFNNNEDDQDDEDDDDNVNFLFFEDFQHLFLLIDQFLRRMNF